MSRLTTPQGSWSCRCYRKLGFRDCGLLTRQVVIDGVEDDEVLLELFLT